MVESPKCGICSVTGGCPCHPGMVYPPLTCSEVVERLANECVVPLYRSCTCHLDKTDATAILHSWRERRVQELRDAFESLPQWDKRRVGMYEALNILESAEWREQIRKGAKHE